VTGKYTISAVDRAGVPWDVCMTDHEDSAADIVNALVAARINGRTYWVTLTDDPERGEIDPLEEV
jgi:hypothetical protein